MTPMNERKRELLKHSEVADMFRVTPRTVDRWVSEGKLAPIRTLGRHRRYRRQHVEELLQATAVARTTPGSWT